MDIFLFLFSFIYTQLHDLHTHFPHTHLPHLHTITHVPDTQSVFPPHIHTHHVPRCIMHMHALQTHFTSDRTTNNTTEKKESTHSLEFFFLPTPQMHKYMHINYMHNYMHIMYGLSLYETLNATTGSMTFVMSMHGMMGILFLRANAVILRKRVAVLNR